MTVSPALPEWRLEDLYADKNAPALTADLAKARAHAQAFKAAHKGQLEQRLTQGTLAQVIGEYEHLQDLMGRLMSYAYLLYATDLGDPARAKFYGDISQAVTDISSELLFFELELNRLEDQALEVALNSGTLAPYAPWIEDIRKEKPYQLADEIEKLFLEKSVTGAQAWSRLFDETIADLRFEIDAESLTLEPTLALLSEPDEDKRHKAAQALAKVFRANLRLFTLITNVLAKDKNISDRWRGFPDFAASRHLANRVEREVVEALVESVSQNYANLSHRYYALKAKWFGKTALNHWDRNAPLPEAPMREFSWSEARDIVLSAFNSFSPQMSDIARRFFDEGWIDAAVKSGKSSGAFAHPTVPSAHPYVLVNYLGKPRDVMTLAHELGHGVHQVLAAQNGALMASTPLTLAETASVFGEMLTFRKLLATAANPQEHRALLAAKVEDMLNTVVRQIAFYKFERLVHAQRQEGELTSEQISAFWLQVQRESLGPAIHLGEGYETFWAYIGHFVHTPFYVYAYAFGDCLVNSLYGLYERGDEGFVDHYFALLSAGGSKPYRDLLAPFGLDPRDRDFWTIGLSVIARMIDKLEAS